MNSKMSRKGDVGSDAIDGVFGQSLDSAKSAAAPAHSALDARSELHALEGLLQDDAADAASNAISTTSAISRKPQTASERLREQKLREDSMALVCDPRLVQCRRCGARIKLSLKSAYDPCHWQKHRMRCLKRSDQAVEKFRLGNDKLCTRHTRNTKSAPKSARRNNSRPASPVASSPAPSTSTAHEDSSSLSSAPTSPIQITFPEPPATQASLRPLTQRSAPLPSSAQTPPALSHSHEDRQQPSSRFRGWSFYGTTELNRRDEMYWDDWCLDSEPWRRITFQESGLRFTATS